MALRVSPTEPVHLIAHSMGGLDARYMVSRLDMNQRLLSLTTLGTPHRDTSFPDWGTRHFGRPIRPLLEFLSIPSRAFYDLTTAACRKFNEEVPNAKEVRYFFRGGPAGGRLAPSRIAGAAYHRVAE